MADALRKTRNRLRALADDHRSGAAEIADRAAALLEDFCRQASRSDPRLPYALSELAETTLRVQASLAPLLNLANRLQLAAERNSHPLRGWRTTLKRFRRQREQATAQIASLFTRSVPKGATLLTYSYSSTVLAAVRAAARRVERVILSEARPLCEGRRLAARLAAEGLAVTLVLDAALPAAVAAADLVVVGADAVFGGGYVNKVGTRQLQEQASRAGKPFFVLADRTKFLPSLLALFHSIEDKPPQEVWPEAPAGATVVNRYFEFIPFERHLTLLTERGVLPPVRVPAWLRKQPVARRWQASSNRAAAGERGAG